MLSPLFSVVTQDEVEQLLKILDPRKATGSDNLPTSLLKVSASQIAPAVCNLFNSILQTGVIPEAFKFATITPVYKAGDPASASNYRPISLLPVLSKLLEKVVVRQLTDYINLHPELSILPEEQFAYREGRSTEDALTVAIDCWSRAIDSGQYVGVCLVDMSKAFDRVSHTDLLLELHECGL